MELEITSKIQVVYRYSILNNNLDKINVEYRIEASKHFLNDDLEILLAIIYYGKLLASCEKIRSVFL